jgi:cell wall-associated NlpC family hydrolase
MGSSLLLLGGAMGKSIVVNGRHYDTRTGLPISDTSGSHVSHISRNTLRAHKRAAAVAKPTASYPAHPANTVHKRTQKSSTLNRKFTKKPSAPQQQAADNSPASIVTPQVVKKQNIQRIDGMRPRSRTELSRKTVATSVAQAPTKSLQNDMRPATHHPLVKRVHQTQAVRKQTAHAAKTTQPTQSASALKQAIVNEAVQNAPKHHAKQYKHGASKKLKLLSVICGCAALMLFGGYLTYLNAPNLSVRVAGAQAGIDASYPSYHPDGYRLNGPVAFSDGEVSMTFVANSGTGNYTLQQSKSNWDSNALLENYIKGESGDNYSVSQEKGITVYNYKNQAAWVSGGILYTIKGDANLSPDQIRKIATSV